MTDRPLFGRPFRDPILLTWLAMLCVIAVAALNANTTWSGHLESDRVAGFLADFILGAILSLAVLLVPAYFRWFWRYSHTLHLPPRGWWGPGFWRSVFSAYRAHVSHRNVGGPVPSIHPPALWPLGGRLFASSGGEPSSSGMPFPTGPTQRPRFSTLTLRSEVAAPGVPAEVTWRADHAQTVTIDGIHGFPPAGSARVQVHASGPLILQADGAGGTTVEHTSEVLYIAVPEIAKVSMPPGPGMHLETRLALRSEADPLLHSQVGRVLQAHQRATQRLVSDRHSGPPGLSNESARALLRDVVPSTDRLRSTVTSLLHPAQTPPTDASTQGRQQ